jgi:hypothetical protein
MKAMTNCVVFVMARPSLRRRSEFKPDSGFCRSDSEESTKHDHVILPFCRTRKRSISVGFYRQVVFKKQHSRELIIMRIRSYLSLLVLATATTTAFAQSPAPAAQPTPQEIAQRNQQIEQAAMQVAGLVDNGQEGQVWDGASSITKQLVARDAFVKGVSTDRKAVGTLITRAPANLSFSQSDGKKLPAGLYANVAFATRFANEKQPVRELISFHLDGDNVWRVTGYTLR